MVYVQRSLHLVACVVAPLRAGAGVSLVDTTLPVKRLEFVLRDTSACVLLTSRFGKALTKLQCRMLGELGCAHVILEDALAGTERAPLVERKRQTQDSSRAVIIYTSGSTGTPKGVELEVCSGVCTCLLLVL